MEGGGDALTLLSWTQLNAVDQGAEDVGSLGPDARSFSACSSRWTFSGYTSANLG